MELIVYSHQTIILQIDINVIMEWQLLPKAIGNEGMEQKKKKKKKEKTNVKNFIKAKSGTYLH